MKNYLLLLLTITFFSCGDGATAPETITENPKIEDPTIETIETPIIETNKAENSIEQSAFLGYYVGEFKAAKFNKKRDYTPYNKINISLDSVRGEVLYGHSVVAGNERPFEGEIKKHETGANYWTRVSEPGDDRYDGIFEFIIFPDRDLVEGVWLANNKKLAVYERSFSLKKKEFKYNANLTLPEDVSWSALYQKNKQEIDEEFHDEILTPNVLELNASTKELTKEDVENMYKGDLEIIRNTIYAKHGYSFKNRKIRFVFDRYVDWYFPVSTDIRRKLTRLERKNEDLIKRYENHAGKYYDDFGR